MKPSKNSKILLPLSNNDLEENSEIDPGRQLDVNSTDFSQATSKAKNGDRHLTSQISDDATIRKEVGKTAEDKKHRQSDPKHSNSSKEHKSHRSSSSHHSSRSSQSSDRKSSEKSSKSPPSHSRKSSESSRNKGSHSSSLDRSRNHKDRDQSSKAHSQSRRSTSSQGTHRRKSSGLKNVKTDLHKSSSSHRASSTGRSKSQTPDLVSIERDQSRSNDKQNSPQNSEDSFSGEDDDTSLPDEVITEEFLLPDDNDCDEDPSELALECLRMFTGYEPPSNPKASTVPKLSSSTSVANDKGEESDTISTGGVAESILISGKKRVAHAGSSQSISRELLTKPLKPKRLTLSETVAKRYELLRAQAQDPPSHGSAALPGGKKRISHVSNVACLMKSSAATPHLDLSKPSATVTGPIAPTLAQTVAKNEQRIAHRPNVCNILNID